VDALGLLVAVLLALGFFLSFSSAKFSRRDRSLGEFVNLDPANNAV